MKNHILWLAIFALLSGLTAYTSFDTYQAYTANNARTFDGVMYEYQKVRRFEKLQQGSGLGNRIGSVMLEAQANPNAGAYNGLLCLLWPSSLVSGADLMVRSALALFALFYLLHYLLLKVLGPWKLLLMAIGICLLPGLRHISYGTGSYIPDAVAIMYITSALLSLYIFLKEGKYLFVFLSGVLVFLAISMRLNTAVYSGFMFIPFVPAIIKFIIKAPIKKRLISLGLAGIMALPIVLYTVPKLSWLIEYNTQLGYGRVDLMSALERSLILLKDLMGLSGGLLCLFFLFLGISTKQPRGASIRPIWVLSSALFFIYGIVILWRRTPEIPHVLNACYLFFPLVFLGVGMEFRRRLPEKMQGILNSKPFYGLVFLVLSAVFVLNISYHIEKRKVEEEALKVPAWTADFILGEVHGLGENQVSYLILFEEMLNVPIQTHIYKSGGAFFEVPYMFFFQENLLRNTGHCPDVEACADYYSGLFDEVEYIGINDTTGKKNTIRAMHPFADSVATMLEAKIRRDTGSWEATSRYGSEVHGSVIMYRKRDLE